MGSNRDYDSGSLSKYGMGLKSAGLSLGTRISIISKKNSVLSDKYVFDTTVIKENNKLVIIKNKLSSDEEIIANELLSGACGTIVEIDGCENVNQSSPNNTITKLKERLGVVYYSFLKRNKKPLSISTSVVVEGAKNDIESISARDILFLDDAKNHRDWTEEGYDFVSPYLVLDNEWNSLTGKNGETLPSVKIHAVAFPQARLANRKSPLSESDKRKVNSYAVSRENSGFFIYRNGRLIRWGDSLDGPSGKLIGKDDINLRISFEITESHDDVFHVDVSKQRLDIDDELLLDLERIISKSVKTAKEIRQACDRFLIPKANEGDNFSRSIQDVAEDDPLEASGGEVNLETLERKEEKNSEAENIINQLESEDNSDFTDNTIEAFRKVRYSERIPHGQVWKPYYHSKDGVFVCISRAHPFYQEFISKFEEGTLPRLIVEALIFSVGLAESNVFDHEYRIEKDVLERIFRRFHGNIDRFLSEWSFENLDVE